ncbi:MAG: sigma-70 family RNA polymerase sigma factor [Alphaproteobacteria bacterium]|nr:sigma-70 family RNA polymerase sigma factor [Alphaproteobacteria bacterium]
MARVAGQSRAERPVESGNEALEPLLAAAADGDRDAFAKLYRLTSARLFAIACKLTGDKKLAEEALQEAFLAIWQNARLYDAGSGAAIAWMTTIVRHKVIDRLRLAGTTREIAVGADAELEPLFSAKAGMESKIVLEQSIQRCLDGLTENQRELVLLAFYYGLTHDELSRKTSAPLGTVKSNVRRGLASLKACLER